MNGDSVSDVFNGTTTTRFILGQVFTYTWTFVSICFFQNICFVIVEDSYMNVKYSKSYAWLRDEGD